MPLFRLAALLLLALPCAAQPLRVLYLGTAERTPRMTSHALMRDLGRDAIWFDYVSDPAAATPDFVAKFDLVVIDAPATTYAKTLATVPAAKRLTASSLGDATATDYALTAKPKLLAAVGRDRVASWEKFLAQREPEQREARPTIANYEKRAQPVTFQFPLSVKGSRERTQVAPDLRLELFASEPDIAKPIFMAWDERGRAWIAETRDYPHAVKPDGMGTDSIKICEDTDGDGRADKFTIFADKLNIPTGFVFTNGGIVVAQPPRFLFLKDNNGDDKADLRTEILKGAGVLVVSLTRGDKRQLMLRSEADHMIDASYDLRDVRWLPAVGDAFAVMLGNEDRVIGVIDTPPNMSGDVIEVALYEKPLRQAMIGYGINIFILSVVLSVIVAGLVYLALNMVLIRPMKRLTRNMVTFAQNPEDRSRIITPSARRDEIGLAERELHDMQSELAAMLQQKSRLAALGQLRHQRVQDVVFDLHAVGRGVARCLAIQVAQAHIQGIELQAAGEVAHHGFNQHHALRSAETAKRGVALRVEFAAVRNNVYVR